MDIFTCIFGSVSYKVLIPFFIESMASTSIPPDGKLLPPFARNFDVEFEKRFIYNGINKT